MADLIERLRAIEDYLANDYADNFARTVGEAAATLCLEREAREKAEKDARHYPTVAGENIRLREERDEWQRRAERADAAEASLAEAKRLLKRTLEVATRNEEGEFADEARRFLSQEPNHER